MLKRVLPLTLVTLFVSVATAPEALAGRRGRRSAATITASFADSCRDFATHSSKDISHVEVHYADGRVVKDEHICGHDYTVDGGPGDEIESAIVKSGTTTEQFDCEQSNRAPTARLEVQTPPVDQTLENCHDFDGLLCEQSSPRTAWTHESQIPDLGNGVLLWGCGGLSDRSLCSFTIRFRGIGSSDPDGDITSWSLDFGDGTSASGDWSTSPPREVAHAYSPVAGGVFCGGNPSGTHCVVTLTVTDSAGQTHSESMVMVFLDQSPD
jgi:hypothetical protein